MQSEMALFHDQLVSWLGQFSKRLEQNKTSCEMKLRQYREHVFGRGHGLNGLIYRTLLQRILLWTLQTCPLKSPNFGLQGSWFRFSLVCTRETQMTKLLLSNMSEFPKTAPLSHVGRTRFCLGPFRIHKLIKIIFGCFKAILLIIWEHLIHLTFSLQY